MRNAAICLGSAALLVAAVLGAWLPVAAQPPMQRPPMGAGRPNEKREELPPLPSDERLLALHLRFVKDAEKLAAEYEGRKQLDQAAAVYQEILKLVPAYLKARQSLEKINLAEATANQRLVSIAANEGWQDTGVRAIEGKPLRMVATGKWTLKMNLQLGPEGLDVPAQLKDFKPGSLIGVIATDDPKKAKPFYIGDKKDMIADRSGPLWVRINHLDPSGNEGTVTLQVVGRFDIK